MTKKNLTAWQLAKLREGFKAAGLQPGSGLGEIPISECVVLDLVLEWSGNCFIIGNYIDTCAQETTSQLKICFAEKVTFEGLEPA